MDVSCESSECSCSRVLPPKLLPWQLESSLLTSSGGSDANMSLRNSICVSSAPWTALKQHSALVLSSSFVDTSWSQLAFSDTNWSASRSVISELRESWTVLTRSAESAYSRSGSGGLRSLISSTNSSQSSSLVRTLPEGRQQHDLAVHRTLQLHKFNLPHFCFVLNNLLSLRWIKVCSAVLLSPMATERWTTPTQ